MTGRISLEEYAEKGKACKGLLGGQAVEGKTETQEVGGMLRRGRQPGMLVSESQSPGRVLGMWPATWGNCVAEPQAYPSKGPWTIPQASQRLPPQNHSPD